MRKEKRKELNFTRSQNTAKILWATLLSLMLIGSFAASGMQVAPVKAAPLFTLHATETKNPDWGYYGGYHPVWAAIINACAQIGIEVQLNTYDDFEWYDRVWESGWNKSWSASDGWDMFISEKRLQPHAVDPWFTSAVAGWADPWPPPEGRNIHPWKNDVADELLDKGMHDFDASQRRNYLWRWQEQFMYDPPWANIYYPKVYELIAKWVSGYDPSGGRWHDTAHLTLNNTMLAEARPDRDNRTIIYAVSEKLWSMNPMFTDTYTDEIAQAIRFAELYKWSIDPFNAPEQMPALDEYVIKPDMAADYPKYLKENTTQPNGTRVRVPLRQGMVWSDGVQINATDVKWTYDTIMIPESKATGTGDFSHVIKSVEIVDKFTVDFILYEPYPDILSVLANDWGTGSILPWHQLKDISVGALKGDATNTWFSDPDAWMVSSGPFKFRNGSDTVDPGPPISVTYDRNPLYFGYNESIMGVGNAWGPYNIDTIILVGIPDAADRLVAFQNYDIDFGEYPTAPVQTFKDINATDPYLYVSQYDYPASNPVWFNFDEEHLSNRYIRMAIAHVIPYSYIINQLLPAWGIETAYRGKTYIMPQHYYEGEWLFHDTLLPNAEDAAKAQKYMTLWENSLLGGNPTLGPAGDADFSGSVDLDDFYIWRENFGESTPFDFLPGQDIDPDFDNDDLVAISNDFYLWQSHFGDHYP